MNIHINKDFYNYIISNTKTYGYLIGSKLYGTSNENSDTDILIIYHPFYNQLINPFSNQHQFQYKDVENDIDYNLVDIISFIKNLVSGDSTINFELIHSNQIIGTDIEFLYNIRNEFNTFNIAKSYLGFARRDVKHFYKRDSFHDQISGYLHIKRSIYIANAIIENDLTSLDEIYVKLIKDKELIKNMNEKTLINLVKGFNQIIDSNRKEVTSLHDNNSITKFLRPETQTLINSELKKILIISEKDLPLDQIHFHNENIEFKY